jgi:hypothetical protein
LSSQFLILVSHYDDGSGESITLDKRLDQARKLRLLAKNWEERNRDEKAETENEFVRHFFTTILQPEYVNLPLN